MKVIENLKKFSFAELKAELEKLYISNEGCGFYNFTMEQWNTIYKLFSCQKDVETTNVIYLIDSWERGCPLIDMNRMGCDKELGMISILAMRPNLKEVMGMEVYVEASVDITDKEIAAGLFWELTYIATDVKERFIKKALENL